MGLSDVKTIEKSASLQDFVPKASKFRQNFGVA